MQTGRFRTSLPSPRSGQKLISCSTNDCSVYECELKEGFRKGESVEVTAEVGFDAEAASESGENRYTVRSLIRRSDSDSPRDFLSSDTVLYSLETSFAELANQHKYHIAGALVGALLAVAVVVLLWKSQVLSKLRIFDRKIEEAKRQSVRN